MESDYLIFVYKSPDGTKCALSIDENGANLPRLVQWHLHDQIPMRLTAIAAYAARADVALMHVITDGYFIEKTADIIPFTTSSRRHRSPPCRCRTA